MSRCFPGPFNAKEEEENPRPTKGQANLYTEIVGTAPLSTHVNAALQSQSQKRKRAEDEEEILVLKSASNFPLTTLTQYFWVLEVQGMQ
ncbi:hypothetical protein MMC29_003317, partial [Sticta canariensis]|nr:hypothetical protein [Sticta canariensis]